MTPQDTSSLQSEVQPHAFRGIDPKSLEAEAEAILHDSSRLQELSTEELYNLNQRKEAFKQAVEAQR